MFLCLFSNCIRRAAGSRRNHRPSEDLGNSEGMPDDSPMRGRTANDRREMAPQRSFARPLAGNGAVPAWVPEQASNGAGLLVPAQEVQHVVISEAPVAASGHPKERDLTAIAQPLDGVHV